MSLWLNLTWALLDLNVKHLGLIVHTLKSGHWFWWSQYLKTNWRNWSWNWTQDLIFTLQKDPLLWISNKLFLIFLMADKSKSCYFWMAAAALLFLFLDGLETCRKKEIFKSCLDTVLGKGRCPAWAGDWSKWPPEDLPTSSILQCCASVIHKESGMFYLPIKSLYLPKLINLFMTSFTS